MSDIDISPLAKRLAEENNVDWRGLNGTGDAGKIVERDVLDYLARVMAGEADMDPTPEPLPAGMEAWSDVDPGFGGSDSAWSGSGDAGEGWDSGDEGLLEQDTAAPRGNDDWSFSSPEASTAASSSSEAAPGTFSTSPESAGESGSAAGDAVTGGPPPEIDEGIFVFDDEPTPASPSDSHRGSASWADDATEFDKQSDPEVGTGFGGNEFGGSGLGRNEFGGSESGGNDFGGNDFGRDDFFALTDDQATTPSAPSGGFSWDEPENSPSEAGGNESISEFGFDSDAVGSAPNPVSHHGDSEVTPWGEGTTRDTASEVPTPWGDDATAGSVDPVPSEPETPWEAAKEFEPEVFESEANDSWQDAGVVGGQDLLGQQVPGSWQDKSMVEPVERSGGGEEPWQGASTSASTREEHGGESPWEEPTRDAVSSDDGFGAAEGFSTGGAASPLPSDQTTDTAYRGSYPNEMSKPRSEGGRSVPTGMRSISGSGIALRRDVDLTAVWQAQRAVSAELGLDEVIAPAAFLLRAAARAGRPWPFTSPGDVPSRAVLSDAGILAELLPDAGTMPFRELVAICRQSPRVGGSDDMSLAVADLSVLDIDEAVLDLGCPVLTLGRILPQSQPDRFHGTITLSGPVAPDAGSRFLKRVVELLSAPVRLVL